MTSMLDAGKDNEEMEEYFIRVMKNWETTLR
jgi:hypothetical protein